MKAFNVMETSLRQHLPDGEFKDVSPKRSHAMAAVRGKDNKTTERRLRLALVRAAVSGWKLHSKNIHGKPDFYFPEHKLALFVDGCFWHGCPNCGHFPNTNSAFWRAKIERNQERDRRTTQQLIDEGYYVTRMWEHELRDDLTACVDQIRKALARGNCHPLTY